MLLRKWPIPTFFQLRNERVEKYCQWPKQAHPQSDVGLSQGFGARSRCTLRSFRRVSEQASAVPDHSLHYTLDIIPNEGSCVVEMREEMDRDGVLSKLRTDTQIISNFRIGPRFKSHSCSSTGKIWIPHFQLVYICAST